MPIGCPVPMVSPESIHARNIYVYTSTYIPTIIIDERGGLNGKKSGEGYMGRLGRRKGKGEML